MDLEALEYTRQHYNRHAGQYADTQQALLARESGPGAPLKKFHNNIKRQLIQRFAGGAPRLLDLCCGRGGDIWKWINAGVQYVKGIDLSEGEIEEAQKRLEDARQQRRGQGLQCEFVSTPELGLREWREEEQYDVVTCMFAIHYFFVTEQALKQFLHNVSINLKHGGYFLGTVPDGKRVNRCIKGGKVYQAPMLQIQAHWQGSPQCFGSPYICAIGDTVTSGDVGSMGSFEYLVYFNVLEAVAKQCGLRLVTDYDDEDLELMFEKADRHQGFKHFSPQFPRHCDPSLSEASALNVAFVFQKTSDQPRPPPRQRQAGGGGGGRPAGRQQQQQQQRGAGDDAGRHGAGKRQRTPEGEGGAGGGADVEGGEQREGTTQEGEPPEQSQQQKVAGQVYKRPTARRRVQGQGQQ